MPLTSPHPWCTRIYFTSRRGITVVVKAGREFTILATNKLDDAYTISSMAVVDSRIFMRTSTHLLCIGEKGTADERR